jgi:hypothetical protein
MLDAVIHCHAACILLDDCHVRTGPLTIFDKRALLRTCICRPGDSLVNQIVMLSTQLISL